MLTYLMAEFDASRTTSIFVPVRSSKVFQFENFNLKRYNYADYYDNECLEIMNVWK
jgi:hypothetical protein